MIKEESNLERACQSRDYQPQLEFDGAG